MTTVKSLMNEEQDEHMQNFIEGQQVAFGDEVEVSKEYEGLATFKSMIKYDLVEIVEEEESEEE